MSKRIISAVALLFAIMGGASAQSVADTVNIPGTIQAELGCAGPWAPDCEATFLAYNADWDVWTRAFDVPAGNYEYKAAINGSWAENYGAFADKDGPNIILSVPADTSITFTYDHKTNWMSDSVRHYVVTALGDFQTALGCASNDDPACLRSWLQDIDGDGVYQSTFSMLPAGDYTARFNASGKDIPAGESVQGEPVSFTVSEDNQPVTFVYDSALQLMVVNAGGAALSGNNLREARAYWVSRDTIAWNAPQAASYQLLYSDSAAIELSLFGLAGDYETLTLTPDEAGLSETVLAKFPHLAGLATFKVGADDLAKVADILRGQVVIGAFNEAGAPLDISALQIPGVLDDLYTTDVPLGVTLNEGVPSLSVWAPTAKNVSLLLFDDSSPRSDGQEIAMSRDDASGVWSVTGDVEWMGKFYLYKVEVYAPSELAIVVNEVTDPYSVSLSVNSQRSQIVDLNDSALKPAEWDSYAKPDKVQAPEDITIYELHIRDFSAFDESVPEELRGTYLAFTLPDSAGVEHLRRLAEAGMTHLHLLPSFDIATINENRARWFTVDPADLVGLPADSEEQQMLVSEKRSTDGFNWGYDPFHFNVPEGSYSTEPDGSTRVLEYRQMVQAINAMGLYVVQDVVYNHTNASGQSNKSVFDRIVPGYYHRLNERGVVATSTCCQNTATEHNMMRRFMVDSVILAATQYKVDGFRFDLMGHHMRADMEAVRAALDSLTLEKDGVDGKRIYVYGEGWNFGEVANNARGFHATQANMAGTGIGSFNDRLRDAVRGGNPFGDRLRQGLGNGLYTAPNGLEEFNTSLSDYLHLADNARIGLAGNLKDYVLVNAEGESVRGDELRYGDQASGYTLDPQENIIYVDKHDNESLFDNNMYKAPREVTTAIRTRMQTLANAFVMYAQGIPFFQAGSDILRSKSMDRNSYDSGDWFNRLDWTYQTNNFGVGLPPAGDNSGQWDLMRPLLADPNNVPSSADIQMAHAMFLDMLRVRYSSPLFRLPTAEEVQARLSFYNVGPEQTPGIIVMHLSDTVGEDLDPNLNDVVVVFNTSPSAQGIAIDRLAGMNFVLSPVLANGADELVKTSVYDSALGIFSVPGYSVAVFVNPQ